MGISGLSRALHDYAELTTLKDASVVIDGPALVYRIWGAEIRSQTLSGVVLGQLPYDSLGQSVISWLNGLRVEGVHVRKIFFDGFLPPRKWNVRLERLIAQTRNMKEATSLYWSLGVNPPRARSRHHGSDHTDLASLEHGKFLRAPQKLPKHPFLVPAVIEALMRSPDWKGVVQVVPGEADAFCARDIRQNGGTVLTTDSDLLIEDLGPKGSVVFLWDIAEKTGAEDVALAARKHSLRELEKRLRIHDFGGLSRMAFEFSSRRTSLDEALLHTRSNNRTDMAREDAYQVFLKEHLPEEYISEDHPVVSALSTLDPRVSELVIQSLNIDVVESKPSIKVNQRPRGPEDLAIFLPVMIEDHKRKSSWSMSESVRQLAYGIVQYAGHQRRDRVIEYRTLETAVGGRQLSIPGADSVEISCERLFATLERINVDMAAPLSRWFAFAVYQDIEWSTCRKETPLSVLLVSEAVSSKDETANFSWDIIHFTAHVQACLYSLRILKQVLGVMAILYPTGWSESKQRLRSCLSTLPSIADYPSTKEMSSLLSHFEKANGVAAISRILGISDISVARSSPPRRDPASNPKARKTGPVKPKKQTRSSQSISGNPFALLDEEVDG